MVAERIADVVTLDIESVEFVRELYPRLREDDAAIERYRAALDRLPPIIVARGRVLVDGFHRWQAHRREKSATVDVLDLGNLTDAEIVRESISRNATHGQQLSATDKRRLAGQLWRSFGHLDTDERYSQIRMLLSIQQRTAEEYTKQARADELAEQQAMAWDLWLDCWSDEHIAHRVGVTDRTIRNWVGKFRMSAEFSEAPASRQHFDIWDFPTADDEAGTASFFGRMPPQLVENLLWGFTESGQVVVDPFAGGGTTIDVCKRMGRRVWASDLHPSTPTLPIHQHDITTGWPDAAPKRADLILLDPPYWRQAAGRYSDDPRDLGNQTLDAFMDSWRATVAACRPHVTAGGRLAFVISDSETDDGSVDHTLPMAAVCIAAGLAVEKRFDVPYSTQQATGQQVTWARDSKRWLKRRRDLVVMRLP